MVSGIVPDRPASVAVSMIRQNTVPLAPIRAPPGSRMQWARPTSTEAVNAALKAAADGPLKGILEYSDAPLVSIDFRGNAHSSILDAAYTSVMDGDFVKILSWYDNEWGYSSRCVDLLRFLEEKGL